MRLLIAALLVLPLAANAYDVTATMPATSGATSCQLYLDGNPVSTAKPCGSAQSYPGLLSGDGSYAFRYRTVNVAGQSALSPTTTVVIGTIPPPDDPDAPPTITVACEPAPCPQTITITITP
jgi:hypothetical protein